MATRRRRRYSKRRSRYPRRYVRYRKGTRRRYYGRKNSSIRTFHVARTTVPTNAVFNTSGSGSSLFTYQFKLSDVPGYATLLNSFDTYRINAVVFKIWPLTNNYDTPTSGTPLVNIPTLMLAPDYTDSSIPTLTELARFDNLKVYRFNRPCTIKFRPAVSAAVYRAGTTFGYTPKWKQWIDHANGDVPHFGLKGALTSIQATSTQFYANVIMKYYLSFKNAK